jgi:hypothetical protein
MAEEEPKTTETPPVAAAAAVVEKEDANGKRGGNRGDHTPVEELFDLSKPIPRVSGTND